MDPVSEILAVDLLDFDMKHVFFPTNSCDFIIEMAGIQVPKGQIAEFDEAYQSRIGPLNDFEKVTFYSDFTLETPYSHHPCKNKYVSSFKFALWRI